MRAGCRRASLWSRRRNSPRRSPAAPPLGPCHSGLAHATYLVRHHRDMALGVGIGFVLLVLLIAAGAYFRSEFYAVGDPRTRWRALTALIWLLAADLLIGLGYLAAPADVPGGYSFAARLETVVNGLVGVGGPVAFSPHDARGDFFYLLMGALGFVTVIVTAHLF